MTPMDIEAVRARVEVARTALTEVRRQTDARIAENDAKVLALYGERKAIWQAEYDAYDELQSAMDAANDALLGERDAKETR